MKSLLLNVYGDYSKVVEIEDDLHTYYRLLDCNMVEIVERKIGRKWFDVICDEEGLFREDPYISAIDNLGSPMFVGNLLFLHHDDEGNMTGLSDREIEYLKSRIQTMYTRRHPEGLLMMTQVEYR